MHTRAHKRRKRARARRNVRAHVFASFTRKCARIFTKICLVFLDYPMNLSCKFHKDRSFCCRDICKTILMFVSSLIFNTRRKRAHTHARLRLVCARVCTDLYEKSFDNSQLSYKYKSQRTCIRFCLAYTSAIVRKQN